MKPRPVKRAKRSSTPGNKRVDFLATVMEPSPSSVLNGAAGTSAILSPTMCGVSSSSSSSVSVPVVAGSTGGESKSVCNSVVLADADGHLPDPTDVPIDFEQYLKVASPGDIKITMKDMAYDAKKICGEMYYACANGLYKSTGEMCERTGDYLMMIMMCAGKVGPDEPIAAGVVFPPLGSQDAEALDDLGLDATQLQ